MTQERLAKIRVRAEVATLGPWILCLINKNIVLTDGPYDEVCRVKLDGILFINKTEVRAASKLISDDHGDASVRLETMIRTRSNARFIAHAREDIPELLDYISELEERADRTCKASESSWPDFACGLSFSTYTPESRAFNYCPGCGAKIEMEARK